MRILVACAVVASLSRFAVAAPNQEPDWSKVEIKATKVGGAVYLLEGVGAEFTGGNIAVSVGADGVLMIDSKFAPLAPKIQAAIKSVSDKPVRFIVNTHMHQDHAGGNAAFVKGPSVTVIAHDNARTRLVSLGRWRDNTPVPEAALPVITFDDQITVHINGEDVRALHLAAGHTDTDIVIFFPKSKVVHMGDDYFSVWYPYIDTEHGGTVKGYLAAVERALGEIPADYKVIPGHGPLSNPTELRAFAAMLKDVIGAVEADIKAGKPLAQIQKEKPSAKYDPAWGHGFLSGDAFVEELYNGLTKAH